MRPLKHGYTNEAVSDGTLVEKRYRGAEARLRMERERLALVELQGKIPVPPVRAARGDVLELGFVPGTPGQELLDLGHAEAVLRSSGRILRRIHVVPADFLRERPGNQVLVHGDFGPNNLLFDPDTFEVTAVVDWEFAHLGDAVEDLAWCEWIVRMHHPGSIDGLSHFFDAYGLDVPPWRARQAAMVKQCEALRRLCDRQKNAAGVRLWEQRIAITAAWSA